MPDAPNQTPPADDPLRLTICPKCFYNLQGLPLEGICPECGNAYDQSGVVVYGWTPQEAEWTESGRFAKVLTWTSAALIAGFGTYLLLRGKLYGILVFFAASVLMIVRLLQRQTLHAPARLQVRFDAAGIHINPKTGELGFGRRRFVPWRKVANFSVKQHETGGCLLYATSRYIPFMLMREYLEVVVDLTDAQRSALYERVERWRRNPRSLRE